MSQEDQPSNVTRLPDEHDRHLSSLYRQVPTEEPPPALDTRVLEAARKAAEPQVVESKPKLLKRRVPLSVAAVCLVAAGLIPILVIDVEQQLVTEGLIAPPDAGKSQAEAAFQEGPADAAKARSPAAPARELERQELRAPGLAEPDLAADAPAAVSSAAQQELLAIKQLLAAGRTREAWQRFATFRHNFPDERVPDDVLTALGEARDALVNGGE